MSSNGTECASTLRAGIRAAEKDAYLATAVCGHRSSTIGPTCVVHWERA